MPEYNGAEHDFLGENVGFRLNHQHCLRGTGNDQVKIRLSND